MSAADQRSAEAGRWLALAHEDLAAAESKGADNGLAPRHRCMLAQQAAEKALKAGLIILDVDPPRTHNLELLADMLPEPWQVRRVSNDLGRLSLWVVESRYPGDWPDATGAEADVAVTTAREVVDAIDADAAPLLGREAS